MLRKLSALDLVDILRPGGPCGEPAVVGLDLDAAKRLAVAGRLAQRGADRIAGEVLQAELLGRDRLQMFFCGPVAATSMRA